MFAAKSYWKAHQGRRQNPKRRQNEKTAEANTKETRTKKETEQCSVQVDPAQVILTVVLGSLSFVDDLSEDDLSSCDVCERLDATYLINSVTSVQHASVTSVQHARAQHDEPRTYYSYHYTVLLTRLGSRENVNDNFSIGAI